MKLRYLPELLLLVTFVFSGVKLIDAHQQQYKDAAYTQTIQAIQQNVVELTVETLRASATYTQHYDKHAQLQLGLQKLRQQLEISHPLQAMLYQFDLDLANYMQLITMLKTSQRFILSLRNNNKSRADIDKMQAMLLSFIDSPDAKTRGDIQHYIESNQRELARDINPYISWPMLMKHIQFVLQNTRVAEHRLLKLQDNTLPSTLVTHSKQANAAQLHSNRQWTIWGMLLLSSVFALVLTALLRQARLLRQKSQEALASSEIKTQFLANMSHEIRTPMNGIIGLTDLCLTTQLNNTQTSYLQKIQFSARSLMTIINDILDFSKIESQKLVIENIDFNTCELLDNLKMMLSKPASDKGIEFIFDIDTQLPKMLNGDPIRIGQVMLNLTSNAIKFTQQGHVVVKVYTQSPAHQQQYLHCRVEDTGIGLTPEQMSRLFKRFTQAQASTTRQYGGTGLGLAISRSLIELMQGEIDVQSEPGKGSVFHFSIPCPTAKQQEQDSGSPELSQFSGQELLIVEDHPMTAEVLQNMAHHLGLQTTLVSSPRQAMAKVKKQKYQFALIDWQLPDMNGLQLIKALEQQGNKPEKIILCTGFNTDNLKQQMQQQHQLLIKPVSLADLSEALSNHSLEDAITNEAKPTEVKQVINSHNQGKRILLVEDNEINQLIAVSMLEQENLEIDIAENGRQAVDKVASQHYDLVLMDIQMPVMDGLEATQLIRQQKCNQQLPIIALTANVMSQEIDHYLQIGMNDHLGKPFEKEHLQQILKRYLP